MQRAFGGHTLMRKDGCQHLRERHAMEPAFTPEYLENWSAAFKQITDNLLDKNSFTGDRRSGVSFCKAHFQ